MTEYECLKCGHLWFGRKEITNRPLSCPKCKNRNWDSEGYVKCGICNRNFLNIHNHHKDGNNKNNINSNIIKICFDCHSCIHNGLRLINRKTENNESVKSRIRKYQNQPEIMNKIERLRNLWIESRENPND